MNESDIRKYANLMSELGLTGLEVTENDRVVRLERNPAPQTAAPVQTVQVGDVPQSAANEDLIEISSSKGEGRRRDGVKMTKAEREREIAKLEKQMKEAARMMEFEYAALLRDQIIELRGDKKK